jgi:hypothetical protein
VADGPDAESGAARHHEPKSRCASLRGRRMVREPIHPRGAASLSAGPAVSGGRRAAGRSTQPGWATRASARGPRTWMGGVTPDRLRAQQFAVDDERLTCNASEIRTCESYSHS